MSSFKKHVFMSSCQKKHVLHVYLSKKPVLHVFLSKKHVLHVFMSKKTCLHVHHANIVQMVKNCYKIKINSRDSKSRFYGVLLSKLHQCLTIVPLLQSNSGAIRV